MKKSLIAVLMLFTLTAGTEAAAQKHRHNPNIVADTQAAEEDTAGIVAYSDTTNADTVSVSTSFPVQPDWDDDFSDNPFTALRNLVDIGVGGTLVAIFGILMVLLILLAPLIAIIVIVWIIVKNRNQRIRLAEKAMETGQPIPQEALKTEQQTDDYLWRKGIKNLFLGLGLVVCGYFFLGGLLQGIGAIFAFYGAGQAVIARTSAKKQERQEENFYEEIKD